MFGAIVNDFLNVSSYIRAVSSFERTKPIRGRDKVYHGVPLRNSRRNSDTYRLTRPLEDGPVTAWMHGTPIVVVSPDDKIVVTPYDSMTTRKVLHYLLPYPFTLSTFHGRQVLYTGNSQHHYVSREFTIDLRNRQVCGLEAVMVRRVDRRAARAAMKPYAAQVETYKVWQSILTPETAYQFLRNHNTDRWGVTTAVSYGNLDLRDVDSWVLMAAADTNIYYESTSNLSALARARKAIYTEAAVYYDEKLEPGTLHANPIYCNEKYNTTY